MSAPRPPLRLVASPPRPDGADDAAGRGEDENEDEDGFEPVTRAPHDRHPPYRELTVVPTPDEDEAAEAPPTPLPPRFVVVALIVFQLLAASTFLGKYVALASGSDQFRFAAAVSVPASLCLYAGAVLLAVRPGRGRGLFLAAAAGLALALPAWGVGYSWSWPLAFGAMLALAGAWFARAELRADAGSDAQP